ncbi:hypothetical protein SNK04_014336 [Fusarium graminearum]
MHCLRWTPASPLLMLRRPQQPSRPRPIRPRRPMLARRRQTTRTPRRPLTPQPDAETEAEIASLGLKDKTAERFRTLASEVKELAPIRDALKAAGIEDVAKLPDVVRRAEAGDFLFDEISKTGTSPEQYGMALDYLGLVAKAGQGDLAAAEKAYEVMGKEYAALAKMLGKEAPGIHDPLAAHADLRAEVEAGDLPRARAIEIAGQRDRAEYTGTVQRHQQETQQAAQKAEERGIQWLQQFDADMRQEDPAYEAKRPALNEAVRQIRETYHPSEWAQRTALAYARIQAPVAVAAPPHRPASHPAPRPDAPERPAPGDGSDHLRQPHGCAGVRHPAGQRRLITLS